MHRAWRSLRSYQFVFHWGIATQSICNYLLHVPQLLSIIEYAVLLYAAAAHLSFSISPSFSLDLARCLVLWFECGPWIDISIAIAQLLWLSILKLLLVFLSRLLISVDLSLTLTLASARFPLFRSPFCWSIDNVKKTPGDRDELWMWPQAFYSHCLQPKGQSSIHLISF